MSLPVAGVGGCTDKVPRHSRRSRLGGSRGVPVLVPVRASPVPSVVRGSLVVKFFFAQHWAQDWALDWRALALTQVHWPGVKFFKIRLVLSPAETTRAP